MPRAENVGERRPRVCYVRNSYYLRAAHLHRNVQALGEAGFEVCVIVLRGEGQPAHERLMPGVEIYRLPVQHHRAGLAGYIVEYLLFFLLAFVTITRLHLQRRFDTVEVDNMPDALVFSALVPKLTGARIILYVADCMADLMVDSKHRSPHHPLVHLLRAEERASAAFADRLMVPNAAAMRRLMAGGVSREKITTVFNCPDDALFTKRPARTWDGGSGALKIVTHGTLIEHYGVQVLIDALPILARTVPDVRVDVYGDGEYRVELEARARRRGVADRIHFWGFVPQWQLPERLAEADIAYAGPLVVLLANKMLEYQAVGVPMVISRWPGVEEYFPNDCVTYFVPGDADDLARAIVELYGEPDAARSKAERAWALYDRSFRWAIQREVFIGLHGNGRVQPG